MSTTRRAVGLREVVAVLEEIAPLELAEEWDNVGLLLEPRAASRATVSRVLLTIDTTAPVVAEALRSKAELVVSYHPPIFRPLASLTQAVARQRSLLEAVRAGIALYSPHTALDAAPGGVHDWLAQGMQGSQPPRSCAPITENAQGRLLELKAPAALATLVQRAKKHLGIPKVRVATADRHRRGRKLSRVLLCAGAGGSVLAGRAADLYITGEMRHHDVLAAVADGTSVILTDHTNTERPYLPVLRRRLAAAIDRAARITIARADAEPLRIV